MGEALSDGIYFDLPEDIYHDQERLSSSRLQKLNVSPGTFWASSWLNPENHKAPDLDDLDEEDAKQVEAATKAQILGKAYHVARLEPDRFHSCYCRELAKADLGPDALTTSKAIEAALKDLGQAQTKAGESVLEKAHRLRAAGYREPIWHLALEEWRESIGDRIPIKAAYWTQILRDMKMIEANRPVHELLSGGFAEVSILWTDGGGVKMKARLDYLKPGAWLDFKSFDNSRAKWLDQAISDAFRFNRYHIQLATYHEAVEMIRQGALDIYGDPTREQIELIEDIERHLEPLQPYFVFQEKSGIPNLVAKRVRIFEIPDTTRVNEAGASEEQVAKGREATMRPTGLMQKALFDIRKAKADFRIYSEVYAPGEPWQPLEPISDLTDLDFSPYWLEAAQ